MRFSTTLYWLVFVILFFDFVIDLSLSLHVLREDSGFNRLLFLGFHLRLMVSMLIVSTYNLRDYICLFSSVAKIQDYKQEE